MSHAYAHYTHTALVTGANKGIGFEIAKKIALTPGYVCFLGARDEARGRKAAEEIASEGGSVKFVQLDINDEGSVESCFTEIEEECGRKLDCLVNNAGVAFKQADPTPFRDQARPTVTTNFFNTVEVTKKFLPLLRASPHPRIVNVASGSGHLRIIPDDALRAKFASGGTPGGLDEEELMSLGRKFIEDVEAGKHSKEGWPNTCYGMSKLLLIAYTKILAKQEPNFRINCCCPGYCATDMTSQKGTRPAEEGARTPYKLAVNFPDGGTTGAFWQDEIEKEW